MKTLTFVAMILLAFVLLGANAKPGPSSSDRVFLYWDINSSLGLAGGPTPSQVAAGNPPLSRSVEEVDILKEAEKDACQRYRKMVAFRRAAAIGGELENFAAAGYALSVAQARVSWATGKSSATVARMAQASEFAQLRFDSVQAANDAGKIAFSEVIAAAEANTKAKISLNRVRIAFEQLGYDLTDVPKQLQIDADWHQKPENAVKNLPADCSAFDRIAGP